MREKGQLFLTEGRHFSTLGEHLSNNYYSQDPLMDTKICVKRLKRNRVCAYSQTISPKLLMNHKGKNSNFVAEKHSRYHFNPVIKVNITYNKTY